MEVQFIGEHIMPGFMGKALIYAAFVISIIAAFAYLKSLINNNIDAKWNKRADFSFIVQSIALFISGILLFYILLSRFYEYKYVWVHAENILGTEYLIAAFWAGQEGSILFWTICQAIFGLLIIRFEKSLKNQVMLIISISQMFMTSLLLGISFGDIHIGMSPFLLLREATENIGNPFFSNPNYLKLITDGNGLNPLLRNFWMMSHPPILFIGFAAALIPFAYAIAGLISKQYYQWIKSALPWALAAILFLGAGLMLGGVWAYESLTFGGFWAWDPVENASLVPWLIFIAALHLMIIAKKNKNTYLPVFLFTMLSFVFVIYSTFLTRSGVLAETSVHSFGNDGMGIHILIYIITFVIIGIIAISRNFKQFPDDNNKYLFSREFWLFAATLIIILSSFQIIFTTSLPVINKIAGVQFAPPTDVVAHYNNWQTPFAIIIALMLGVSNFIKWGKNTAKEFFSSAWFSIILSVILLVATLVFYPIQKVTYQVLLLFSYFALISSIDNLLRFKNKFVSKASAISHVGFALFLIAIIFTFSKKEIISQNTSGFALGSSFSEQENLLLIKNEILPMGKYFLVYSNREISGERIIYQIDFLRKNKEGDFYKAFSSYPSILINDKMGNVFEPYSKIYFSKDIFTYITYAETEKDITNQSYSLIGKTEIELKDTLQTNNDFIVFKNLTSKSEDNNNISITAHLQYITHFGKSFEVMPIYEIKNGQVINHDHIIKELGLKFKFTKILEKPFTIELELYEEREEFIIIKTIVFPFINLLWLSLLIMLIGIFTAMRKRWKLRTKD
jgi:cytochrome c-type biogenesis protein CcmF